MYTHILRRHQFVCRLHRLFSWLLRQKRIDTSRKLLDWERVIRVNLAMTFKLMFPLSLILLQEAQLRDFQLMLLHLACRCSLRITVIIIIIIIITIFIIIIIIIISIIIIIINIIRFINIMYIFLN